MTLVNRLRKAVLSSILISLALVSSRPSEAQESSPVNTTAFTIGASVVSLGAKAETIPATDIVAAFRVTPNFVLRHDSLIAAASQGYFGGVNYFIPSKGILDKTNFDPAAFQFYVTASGGEILTAGFKHAGWLAGGGINYDPTGSGKFTVQLIEVRAARLPYVSPGVATMISGGLKLGF